MAADFTELSRTVRDDAGEVTVRGPDGTVLHRRYLHTPDVVAIVAVQDATLVLVSEFRAAVGTRVVQVPMGKLPAGVDPLEQAHRELAEETGLAAARCAAAGTLLSCPGWMDQRMHVYLATGLTPLRDRPRPQDDDVEEAHSTVVRIPVAEFGHALRSGTVRDARTIAAVHLALG